MGREFGATTGRPRRCGWFDAVATRHATMVNGIDELAVTNVDGLDSVEIIRVGVGYRVGTKQFDHVPNDIELLGKCEPVYAEFPGWFEPLHDVRSLADLPDNARRYVSAIEEHAGVPIVLVSVGPERTQTIERAWRPLRHRPTPARSTSARRSCSWPSPRPSPCCRS